MKRVKSDIKNIKENNTPVAIIGMACFFPKSSGTKEYWRLLFHGEDAITEVPESHWKPEDYFDADPKKPDHVYCKRGGFLSAVSFDPSEFGIPPNTLEATDTSQLLGLVAAKAALEDAGYGQERKFDRSRASVILGVTGTQELVIPLGARLGHPKWRKALKDAGVSPELAEKVIAGISDAYVPWQENSFPGLLGNVVAGRICNRLDLGGTNCVVDAACASSMSAVHLALMELNIGRSDIVITGGVDALNDIFMHTCFAKTLILSPSGDARPFSKDADGTVLGEGIGMVVLKRLADAEKDGDKIYAVIRGLGSSSDGKSQSIYAPNAEGQARALRKAYQIADVDPETVELIEAHGTGTRVGDATEFQALRDVFGNRKRAEGETADKPLKRCGIGSVKSMIGHTKAAAGAAGLIKAVLSLYHKVFPPTLKVTEPDPNLKLEESPFYLSTESRPWFSRDQHPRRTGVSAFGFGGSNFHLVLEEYEKSKIQVAWDASVPRPESAEKKPSKPVGLKSDIAFIFPGQGSQYVNMARDLVCTFPEAFDILEKANKIWRVQKSGQISDLTDFIYPFPALTKEEKEAQENVLRSTDIAQPAIGAASVAMLKILERFGIKAGAACGHSYGELTALYTAGWIDWDTFFRLSIARGHFMASAAGKNSGTMLAVKAPLEDIDALIKEANLDVILANRNSPNQGVLSGSVEAIAIAEKAFKQKKIKGVKLPVSAAFHSSLVKDAQEPFMDFLNKELITPSEMPVFSNTTGKAYPCDSEQAKQILGGQILCPVNFVSEIESMFESGVRTFIEIGPKSVLTGLVKAILKGREFEALALDSSSGKKFGVADLANMLSQLESLGYAVDWDQWDPPPMPKKQRMSIPISGANYRSERKSDKKPVTSGSPEIKTDSSPKVQAAPVSVSDSKQTAILHQAELPGKKKPSEQGAGCRGQVTGSRLQGAVAQGSDARPVIAPGAEVNGPGNPIESRKAMNRNEQITSFDMNRGGSFPRKTKTDTHSGGACLFTDAFKAVQEGLKSMQSLHRQTAETHQKFLETQTQASRTLQMMMENTRRLAEVSFQGFGVRGEGFEALPRTSDPAPRTLNSFVVQGSGVEAYSGERVADEKLTAKNQEPQPPSRRQEPARIPECENESFANADANPSYKIGQFLHSGAAPEPRTINGCGVRGAGYEAIPQTPNPEPRTSNLEPALIQVVSQLTGYPAEMISPDMDIESDLGIDSIKRVEILSTLEERMPGLPSVSPEMMGSLRTLRQIVEYLGGNGNRAQDAGDRSQVTSCRAQDAPHPEPRTTHLEPALIQVVSQLTGYPAEMISPDMDIESDLGIDSIKRVEILSTLEERMPGLPSVSPEMMGSLRTLRQIVEYLGGNGNRAQDAGDRSQVTSCRAQDAPHPEPRTTHLEPVLMQVVSQLTGYPAEMISPDMDIESDLGIDSIKRVEILSTLEERMPGLPSVSPEMMGSLRTLRQIAEYLGTNGDRSQVASGREMQKCNFCTPEQSPNPVLPSRNIVVAVESRFEAGERVNLPSGRQVLITDDGTGLAQAIADEFASLGIEAMIVSPKAQSREFSRSLTLPTQSRERERAESHLPQASGLVILSSRDADFQSQTASLKTAFALTHQLAQDMLDSAKQGGAVFATLTRLDGAFGFKGLCLENPVQGGLAGIVKTASVEWENVCCHAIDIAPDWNDNAAIAKAAVSEMLHRGPAEIGLSPGSRVTLALESSPYPEGEIQLVPGDVVVVSGGARGVTAAAAYALASLVKPVLALMGRSPAPSPEPEWLASLEDETEIKKAVFANEFSGNQASPKQLEKIFRAYMANREITRNIEKLKATGATVLYESLDVRDADAVKSLLDKIRSAYGPVKALIHGAGALEDRLIVDKTPEQFEKVFDTKVMGLKSLLDALPSEELKYLVLFSSVAARAGNKGQSDYAAANEVLNKIAQAESARRPNCRVISINWGPWDGGMVSPLLKREFERKGVKLIPLEAGASAMLQEMRGDKSAPVEVVIGAGLNPQAVGISCPPYAEQKLFLTFKRELDVANYPILSSHVLGGKPVVPFALMTEWLGHGALHGNPGLFLHGLDDIQILSGIKLDEGKKLIRLMAGKARKNSGVYEVDVEIRDGVKDNREVIHSKAKAILTAGPAAPPAFEIPKDMLSQAYPRSIQEAYDKILFHGIELQGIQKILSCSKRGMVAEVSAAPLPEKWMTQPLRSRWIADPLVLDSAFQMAILWCFEEKGLVCLPSYSATFRQYCDRFPSQGITAVLEVTETTQHKMKGDFTFLDAQNAVFAKITGYEAVMNDSLFEAFKNK